jgi:hypothetical protein
MNTVTDNSEVIADLIKERDELKAHCGKLFEFVHDLDSYLDTNELTSIAHGSVFHQEMKHLITFTPHQSLADSIKERDELKAHCERLRNCLMKASAMDADRIGFEKCLGKTLASTPQQSLAEHDAKVIEYAIEVLPQWFNEDCEHVVKVDDLLNYANQLRKQAK